MGTRDFDDVAVDGGGFDTHGSDPLRVVGIGASAGGLEALEAFFDAVPRVTGLAFVVIQHLAPDFTSLMDELLRRHTPLPVHLAQNDQRVQADAVYLIPPRFDMIMSSGRLLLSERDTSRGLNLPIDLFFRSLATDLGDRAVAVILSGTGSDGSRGAVAVREAGGLVVAQDPETAGFDGMPNAAIATGAVDARLDPGEMPEFIMTAPRGEPRPPMSRGGVESPDGFEPDVYDPVFRLLSDHHSVDFNQYKVTTIARRIERRLRLRGCRTVKEYVRVLHGDPRELSSLYQDLLIGVTDFFRDGDAWQHLADDVVPKLFDDLDPDQELRCWVAGAATGQEAYTLAMVLHEVATSMGRPPQARIFATDLHKASVDFASQGSYPADALGGVSAERRERYFVERDGQFQVAADLRKMVVFAHHNLVADPPFTKLDLVTCRNVLIYLQPQYQHRVLTLFHFGLRRGGALFLGSSESLGDLDGEFDTLDRKHKQFSKRRDGRLPVGLRELRSSDAGPLRPVTGTAPRPSSIHQQQLLRAYDALLERYVPSAFVIDGHGSLLHTFGDASRFLKPMVGRVTTELAAVIHPELRLPIVSGLQRLQRDGQDVTYGSIRVQRGDGDVLARVTLSPLSDARGDDTVLVIIEEEQVDPAVIAVPDVAERVEQVRDQLGADSEAHLKHLEAELRFARENLQTTVEELETTNEELQATNEELAASNEELQSSNEELHSVNEELYSVNKEYEAKIEELTQLTDDMENLLTSTQIGTVFLDPNLRVRKFTPAAAEQFNLLPQDIGRPIAHMSRNIDVDDFGEMLQGVLDTGEPVEVEVQHHLGHWYLMRIHPYLVDQHLTGGVVVTLIDIQTMKHVSASLARRNADLRGFAYGVSHDLQEPIRVITSLAEIVVRRFGDAVDEGPDDDGDLPAMLEQISTSSRRLRAMLDAMLVFSRVDTWAEEPSPCAVGDLVADVMQDLADELRSAGAELRVEGELPVVVGDRNQLAWLFAELVHNACRYRSADPPVITVSAARETFELVRIEVRDNGRGIPPAQAEVVFDMFTHLRDGSDERGLGAGLTIARRIVERHGGEIHVDPHRALGTCVWFTLPVEGAVTIEVGDEAATS